MNQYEVPAYLSDELPELQEDIKKMNPALDIIKSIQCLSDYTRDKVMHHELSLVKKCFAIAEKIYSGGNAIVRNAVENIFIYSFSSILNLTGREEKKQIQALMPLCLHTAYVQQIYKSGI